jgi:formylglycine-generating enzyme required for sulfatase activity
LAFFVGIGLIVFMVIVRLAYNLKLSAFRHSANRTMARVAFILTSLLINFGRSFAAEEYVAYCEKKIRYLNRLSNLGLLLGGFLLAGCDNANNSGVTDCAPAALTQVGVPSGSFTMGANPVYAEEGPPGQVSLAAFDIDSTEVTNAQFARFVDETGYVTDAERRQPGFGEAGGVVFQMPSLNNPSWWQFVAGADWRHPDGPDSSLAGRMQEPVVQVSHRDAQAYAAWAGRRLPKEAEWEYAANAGAKTIYVWGDELAPNGAEMANTWQGSFPIQNTQADGYAKRAPVGCFPANDFGLYDMIGNVWEWTDSKVSQNGNEVVYTIKGGSFLCAPNYCRRYRAAARQAQEAGLPTSHIGFRTVSTR